MDTVWNNSINIEFDMGTSEKNINKEDTDWTAA